MVGDTEVAHFTSQYSQGRLDFRTLDRLMAYRCLRLAAIVANAAGQGEGNTYTWILGVANARRWDSELMLIPAGYLTDHCCLFRVRERRGGSNRRASSRLTFCFANWTRNRSFHCAITAPLR
jgi:hypothetical protein